MKGSRPLAGAWLLVVLWLCVIFTGSSDLFSARNTSRVIRPLLRWLKPDISEEMIKRAQISIRKGAHVATYAVLSILLWRALRLGTEPRRRAAGREPVGRDGWNWTAAGWALAIAVACAATDEVHQSFVVSRHGSASDMGIDAAGAVLGLGLAWSIGRWRHQW